MMKSTVKQFQLVSSALLSLLLIAGCSPTHMSPEDKKLGAQATWLMAGQNLQNTRHQSDEFLINTNNVGELKVKWALPLPGSILATPAVEGEAIYISDVAGNLYKINRKTGEILWQREISFYTGIEGDFSRNTPAVTDNSLLLGNQPPCIGTPMDEPCGNAFLLAVDKETGKLLWKTVIDTIRSAIVTQSAVVDEGLVYVGVASNQESLASAPDFKCCDFRGKMLSVDAANGAIMHTYHATPPTNTGYSGAAIWSDTAVVDHQRNLLYITTGDNYSVPQKVMDCVKTCQNCSKQQLLKCDKPDENVFDSIVALELPTLKFKWAFHGYGYDAFNNACIQGDPSNCPSPAGPDYDFGQGVALFTAGQGTSAKQLLGAGEKSGVYYALDPSTGEQVWATKVGPGGTLGGSEWGSATDGKRIYVAISNSLLKPWKIQGSGSNAGKEIHRGLWSALDASTGEILWQTPELYQAQPGNPLNGMGPQAAVTIANGVLFAGSTTPNPSGKTDDMLALNAADGKILWKFSSGGTINSGPAVVDGEVYWGNVSSNGDAILYAFCIRGTADCP
ncbi:MAG: PQQ-binding-like beta-propeller repeat protein [Verrucomicrobia bacterium]|nr:PQQ-binding-like beta-propeller repeat protein [Verrucomicrobiota bacterium]